MTIDAPDVTSEIIDLWRQALGVDDIAEDDDFFELGGNSITAIRLLPLISDQFTVELDAMFLFDHPTPREFATALDALTRHAR
jgi:acyl carrier protein